MGNLFAKSTKNRITEVDKAVLTLKTQRRKLQDYQKKVEAVVSRENEVIRELIKEKKKDRAMVALRRRKLQEEMLKKADVWVMNVEQQLADIEVASRQKEVFESMKAGQAAIKQLQSHIRIEDVEKLVEETEDAKEYQNELKDLMAQQQLTVEEEEAVNEEFAKLEEELGMTELEEMEASLPPAPSHAVESPSVPERQRVQEEPQRQQQRARELEPIAA
eukprot:TRINITY_DN3167_c0_g1_i1.p1 TRINITY_DN3167_c0_g1~~TRINITY_DN3167_c0_g1_i1.p1  ORF type:complete len:219 (+),score=93.53 TRINITY_DN3167_c0_g1_i1:110-766(+)